MEQKLREQKIKITPQRLELIRKLLELKDTHPSFSDIYDAIKLVQPSVSRSTVHENLKLLVDLGIIKRFHFHGHVRYEMNLELHVNLVDSSGGIMDVQNDKIKNHLLEILKIMAEDEGIDIKSLTVLME
ncbi:Fur family transcriptional regulator [Methanobacterium alcaliphilum]|uniref:Fur family transcriptional regulator n=1 Tax=Methanobacterium alcaliphilum TaxID=392018 RepID=UPI00200B1D4A|nr:transcriptional repressor [Methanobacterium alcaliphilum]MCK9151044.1 transcriptional repressor [Methanobacterium alcaliphilum]